MVHSMLGILAAAMLSVGSGVNGQQYSGGVGNYNSGGYTSVNYNGGHFPLQGHYQGYDYGHVPATQSCDICRNTHGDKVKITSLTLRYTGSNVGASNNDQGSKFGFSGNPSSFGGATVTITGRSKKGTYGTYTVAPGQTFEVRASKFESESYFEFAPSGARVFFHTSCSVPIRVGDQFGSLQVVDFQNTGGDSGAGCATPQPTCVQNAADCNNLRSCPICLSDQKPAQLSLSFVGGPATVTNSQEGKARASGGTITSASASVSCTGKKGRVGSGNVVRGQSIVITNLRDAGADITCQITGGGVSQLVTLHASCSKPLNVGDRFGAIQVTGFITQDKKTGATRSSNDPNVCPPCQVCCQPAELECPRDITLDCDGSLVNHARLEQWAAAASCTGHAGRKFKVTHTNLLLKGQSTCSVSSEVTWTCTDECGVTHRKSATFSIIDRTAPEVVRPPQNKRSECNPHDLLDVPTQNVNAWISDHGGMRAIDTCQEAKPCAGSSAFMNQHNTPVHNVGWSNSAYGTASTGYALPNVIPYADYTPSNAASTHVPYYKKTLTVGQGDRQNYGYGSTDLTYTESYACAFCPTGISYVCSNGVQYNSPCHAHCAGVTQFLSGACGTQTSYHGGVVVSYGNANCACSQHESPVCSANGQRQYRNPCHAQCAGDYSYTVGPCGSTSTYGVATVNGCSHCASYNQPCCGLNGREYASPCHAACAGIYNFHYGTCTVYAPATSCGNDLTWTHTNPHFTRCASSTYDTGGALQCAEVTFTATDKCGNSVSRPAQYEIFDSQPPEITGGEDLIWPCDSSCAGYDHWEQDARMFLNQWVSNHGCLSASDCSDEDDISWNAANLPAGNLCGASGRITFAASDKFGNVGYKELSYSFPVPPQQQCFICGQSMFGQKVKADLLELTVVYESSNPSPVNVRVYDEKGSRGLEPGSFVQVRPGQSFANFVGQSNRKSSSKSGGSSNKFPTNTVFEFSNGGRTTIHTSCSQPLYVGQTYSLGNGDSIRITAFRTDMSSSETCPGAQRQCQYPQVCGVNPPPFPTDPPTPPPTSPPCRPVIREVCPNKKEDMRELIFRYVASSALTNNQEGKASVVGQTGGNQVSVFCSGGTSQAVSLNGLYILRFDDKPDSETECTIVGPGGTQTVAIHTSCSKDLDTEDQFGNLVLVGFRWADGTLVNNDNCDTVNTNITPYQNWQYGGVDGGYTPPTMPFAPPPSSPAPSSNVYQIPRLTLLQQLNANPEMSTFVSLLLTAGIESAIEGIGSVTVFAPTNSAFNALSTASMNELTNDITRLRSVLLLHIVSGNYKTDALARTQTLTSYNGQLTVQHDNGIIHILSQGSLAEANIAPALQNIAATNGVIHGITEVLLPGSYSGTNNYVPNAPNPTPPPTQRYLPTTMPPSNPNGICSQTQACAGNSKLTSLSFKYVGYNGNNHQQMAWGKGFVNDMKNQYRQTVKVKLQSYRRVDFDPTPKGWKFNLDLNEEFTITGDPHTGKLLANLVLTIGGAKMKISTNCAAHIGVGDKFGVLVVTGWSNINGEECYANSRSNTANEIGSSESESSQGLSAVSIAGIAIGVLAAVLLVGAVALTYIKSGTKDWSVTSSQE